MIDVLKVMYNSTRWEDRFGAINGSMMLIKNFYVPLGELGVDSALKDFTWNALRAEKVPQMMLDNEFRVRNQVGLLLRTMINADKEKGA